MNIAIVADMMLNHKQTNVFYIFLILHIFNILYMYVKYKLLLMIYLFLEKQNFTMPFQILFCIIYSYVKHANQAINEISCRTSFFAVMTFEFINY